MKSLKVVLDLLKKILDYLYLVNYRKSIPRLVKNIRTKEKIRVLFVLSDISLWKTESLYLTMLKHERFEPILGVSLLISAQASESVRKYKSLIEYLDGRKYSHIDIYGANLNDIKADIVFYQQPYEGFTPHTIAYTAIASMGGLICDIRYSFRTLSIDKRHQYVVDGRLHNYSWKMFFENTLTQKYAKFSKLKGKNICVTGIPMQDNLLLSKEHFDNPWKKSNTPKKRIIYAPHHSIPTEKNTIYFSTFLSVSDIMMELAIKYKEKVDFAFKPHPFLKRKLIDIWGIEKTQKYYDFWDKTDNCQLVDGAYQGLFKYSDALIHDCGSFTLEYCFEKKPAMFLVEHGCENIHRDELNEFGQLAYDLHLKGITQSDIEQFILGVIKGEDFLFEDRVQFYDNYLKPPYGKSASQNIINSILGIEEYEE